MQCNVTNDLLTENDWIQIESECIKRHHLHESNKLTHIIKNDNDVMKNYDITFDQLKDFFKKIKYHFSANLKNKEEKNDGHSQIIQNLLPKNTAGWCCWGSNCVKIFNNKITVFKITWGGAETCSFKSPEDTKYHGCEYGSHDWIFINNDTDKAMHIGDLLFHQISEHHFFQDSYSDYRVDPKQLIELFCLKPNMNYKTDIVESYVWNFITLSNQIDNAFGQDFDQNLYICEKYGSNTFFWNDDTLHMQIKDDQYESPLIGGFPISHKLIIGSCTCKKTKSKSITYNELVYPWL